MNIWRNIYLQSKISDEVFETFLFLVTTVFTHPIFYDTIHIVCVSFAVQMTKLVFNTSVIGHPSNIWDLQIIRCLLYYSPYFTCANEYDIGITLSQYIGSYTSLFYCLFVFCILRLSICVCEYAKWRRDRKSVV